MRNSPQRRGAALFICVVGGFLTLLDVSIVTVALPSMERALHLTPGEVSWSLSGYSLAFGLVLVPAGRLGDLFGRRRLLLIGLFLFALTGILCGAATSATMLIAARLARGASAGLIAPQAIGLITQMYPPKERGRAFGLYGAVAGISTAIGPMLGGAILNRFGVHEGWRFVFYLFVPIALLALVIGIFTLPHDRPRSENHSLDMIGAALLGASVVLIMLPLIEAESATSKPGWWRVVLGAVLLAAFFGWEHRLDARGGVPLLAPKLLTIRGYAAGTAIGLTFYAGFTGIFLTFSLFFQQGLKLTPLHGALETIVFVITSAACAIVSGRVVHRFGQPMVVVGCLAAAIGLFTTALMLRHATTGDVFGELFGPLLLAGIGSGLVITPNQTLTMQSVPRTDAGIAAGGFQTGQRIGTAMGTALAGSLFFGELARSHGDFHQAAELSLFGSAGMIALTFLIALVDVVLPHRASVQEATLVHAAGAEAG